MSPFEIKVLKIVLRNPDTFKKLLKQHDHAYCMSILNKWFKNRVGLEFETGDTQTLPFDMPYSKIRRIYDVSVSGDEKRISFGTNGLDVLNYFLTQMHETVPFNTGSGIHVHINSKVSFRDKRFQYVNDISKKYQYVTDKLITLFNYTGKFNSHIISTEKTAIRFHHTYNTIEYRILPMIYDWDVLLKSIMVCQYCTDKITKSLDVDLKLIDTIWSL